MNKTPCPENFVGFVNEDETYITHTTVKHIPEGNITICVTSFNVYMISNDNSLIQAIPFLNVHNVEPSPIDKKAFFLCITPKKAPTSQKTKTPMKKITFKLETFTQRDLYIIIMRRICRDVHQEYFESKYIQEPEVYQMHRHCIRYDTKGHKTRLCIAISTGQVYGFSVHKEYLIPDKILWSFKYENIKSFNRFSNQQNLICIKLNTPIVTHKGEKDTITILFYDTADLMWLYYEIRRLYFIKTNKHLAELTPVLKKSGSLIVRRRSQSVLDISMTRSKKSNIKSNNNNN
eukprot:TRINITY_DN10778_c0_g1_i1.p1 TRINITY_DN10778_c0_g1~~TRINITY_DN10778_c0_g1_i1.p1  ORF type:complete len:290 (+),score=54.12 TRINITY_DN10778_c0_g1_i1:127-996(+)